MTLSVTTYRHAAEFTTPKEVTRVICDTEQEALHARAALTGTLLRHGFAMQGDINIGGRLIFTKTSPIEALRVYSVTIEPAEVAE